MDVLIYSLIVIISTAFIGLYLSRNVSTIKAYAVADRSLPLYVSTATVFATWFGAEAILGIPESFMEHGLVGVVSDPIGSFLCLTVLGLFFARRYYNMNVISIGDFFFNRYGKRIEILASFAIAVSYIGWIAAQFIAFGGALSIILNETVSLNVGIVLGAIICIGYTFKGGMFAVAINDFIQTAIIGLSLIFMFFMIAEEAGGLSAVVDFAIHTKRTDLTFDADYPNYTYLYGVLFSMILGTIPQQDTFQRITSAKSADVAVQSTLLGGVVYLLITLIPIFIVLAATKMQLETTGKIPDDFNLYIAHFVLEHVPKAVQVFFFSALFAAILSTASGTLLATAVVLSRNVFGEFFPREANLLVMRITLVAVTLFVCLFALFNTSSIHALVEDSAKVTMVIVFFPLVFGMFWKRASYRGILAGIIASTVVWLSLIIYQNLTDTKFSIAPELTGFAVSFLVCFLGSLFFPDTPLIKEEVTHHRHIQ